MESTTSDVSREEPNLVSPPRRTKIWELSLATDAFFALGTGGGGVLGSASVSYRFESPFVVRASINPYGLAGPSTTTTNTPFVPGGGTAVGPPTTSSGTVSTFGAHLLGGVDTQFVEVGLGLGGATVNQNAPFAGPVVNGASTTAQPPTSALSVVEAARFGAHDGLALEMEASTILANGQFDIGYFVASFRVPVSRTSTLVLRGGGGHVGFAYGDIGVRVLISGDGGKGTVALTGFVGGAGIQLHLCSTNPDPPFASSCTNADLNGPSLGGGIEFRM
jgi:hypothetical protein